MTGRENVHEKGEERRRDREATLSKRVQGNGDLGVQGPKSQSLPCDHMIGTLNTHLMMTVDTSWEWGKVGETVGWVCSIS